MLSKVHALILGIIDEKPLNPYEITKLLNYIHIGDWFPVAASSVYATIRTLYGKRYITGESRKEGNMPEKTIYTITEKGKKALYESIADYLGSIELDAVKFNIATILLCHIERKEVLKILNKRLEKFEEFLKGISSQLKRLQSDSQIPALGLTAVKHNIFLIEAEIKTTKELISEVEKDNDWVHFLARDIKVQGGI